MFDCKSLCLFLNNISHFFKSNRPHSLTSDSQHYEKVGKDVKCIEDEIPFEIPEGWEWCRLDAISTKITDGSHNPPKDSGIGYPVISAKNIKNGLIDFSLVTRYTDQAGFEKENPRTNISQGDIILGIIGGSIGNLAIYQSDIKCIAQRSIAILSTLHMNHFLLLLLQSPLAQQYFRKQSSGTAQGGVYLGTLKQFLIPIPGLNEQERILSKLNEFQFLIDNYDEYQSTLEQLESRVNNDLKKSILQYAIQGKLVPQNLNDESASVLLERIRAEKEQMIKAGKLKREKNESYIYRGSDNSYYEKFADGTEKCIDEELPFEIPNSWIWCRLKNIFVMQAGKSIPSSEISQEPNSIQKYPCYGGNGIRGYVSMYNHEGYHPLIGRQGALCGNINQVNEKFYVTEHAVVVDSFVGIDINWAILFLKALNLNQYATATAQPGLAVSKIMEVLIPLPPQKEQQKICCSYNSLSAIVD